MSMSKVGNVSFIGELPTYKTAKMCCGLTKATTLYYQLTSFLVCQLVFLLLFVSLNELENQRNVLFGRFESHATVVIGAVFLTTFWLIFIMLSFFGISKKNHYLLFPLFFSEFLVSFCLLAAAGVGLFTWHISLSKQSEKIKTEELLIHIIVFSFLFLFHSFYVYVIFLLQKDVLSKKKTDAFIARQRMLDEVCEEMVWEEEEAEKYRHLPMTGIYYQESTGSYSDGSFCSSDLNTVYMNQSYPQTHQQRRFVTFYDELEDSY